MGKRVGIIVAMQKEWDALFADTELVGCGFAKGRTKHNIPFVAMISGIGKVNAAVIAYKLWKEYDCNHILSFGCAGGSSYDVHVGDVIVGDEFMYWDVNCGSPNAIGQVQGHPETYPSDYEEWKFLDGLKHGLIATGDTFVETTTMASAITNVFYPTHCPLALDMESAAIAQVCERRYVGFTSVRVISDNPFSGERTYNEFWTKKVKILSNLWGQFFEKE